MYSVRPFLKKKQSKTTTTKKKTLQTHPVDSEWYVPLSILGGREVLSRSIRLICCKAQTTWALKGCSEKRNI
jgi:hypothetical protein